MTDFKMALYQLWPNGDEKIPGLRAGMVASAPTVFAKWQITSPLLLAHVMAQISHECGAGHEVVENLSYSAEGIKRTWPGRFPNQADAIPYQKNPRALANKVYNGRMQNRVGSDDGWNYRGRGGSQTTGRESYSKLQQLTGLPLLDKPDLVNDPNNFLECAVADFVACGCMPYAKADNLLEVSAMLNVGHPLAVDQFGKIVGLEQRADWLKRWKAADVAVPSSPHVIVPVQPDLPPSLPPTAPHPEPSFLARLFSVLLSIFNKGK